MSNVYFTSKINKDEILRLYKYLGVKLEGRVAVKLHSGEPGNQNFLGPDYFTEIVKEVSGTVVECNTAYDGKKIQLKNI